MGSDKLYHFLQVIEAFLGTLLILQYFLIFLCCLAIFFIKDKYGMTLKKFSLNDWIILVVCTIAFFLLGDFLDSHDILDKHQARIVILSTIAINVMITPFWALLILTFGKNEKTLNIAKKLLALFTCFTILTHFSFVLFSIAVFWR